MPNVTEIVRQLEPTCRDPFIGGGRDARCHSWRPRATRRPAPQLSGR